MSASALVLLLATCRVDRITQPPPLPILTVSPLRLLDSAAVGSLAARAGTIDLTNTGLGTLSWSAGTIHGAPWLRVSPANGIAPTALRISLEPEGLAPGVYRDTVVVLAENTEGSPAFLPVEFVIYPCVVQPIALDAQLTDSVTLEDCAVPHGGGGLGRLYSFAASTGDSISVFMTSAAFTGHVVLDSSTDAAAAPLAQGSHLRYQLLANSGTFVIEATTAAPALVGAFTLGVSRPRSPNPADSLRQFGVDSASTVAVGGSVDHAAVVLRGSLSDPDGDSLRLEVELRPAADALTDTATAASAPVSNGGRAFVAVHGLADGTPYHWQARVVDQTGRAGPWLAFGGNGGDAPDFSVAGDVATQIAVQAGGDQSATVATAVATPPSVIVRDQFNNPVAGVPVTFLVTAGGGSIDASATTNANGIATTTRWVLGTTAGPNSVTATARGTQITGNPATFAATGTAAIATALAITTPPSAMVQSGIAFPQQPVVQLVDMYGNPAPQGETAILAAIATGGPALSGTNPVVTTPSGTAVFTDLTVTGATGPRTIGFEATDLAPVASPALGVTAGLATQIAVHDGNAQAGAAGDAVSLPPSVIVKDASGNPVAGVPVTFVVLPGHGSITGDVQTSDADGIATLVSWTLGTTAQPCTLIVTAAGLLGSPVTFVDTAKAGAPAIITVISGDSLTSEVGTMLSAPHRVRITDAHGNPVSGISVNWLAAAGGGSVDPSSALTDDAGMASTLRTLGSAPGTQTTSATATLGGLPTTLLFHISAGAGPPAQLFATGGQSQTGPVGTTLPAPLSLQVTDRFGNGVPNVGVTWTVPPGGGSVFPATSVTDPAGTASTSWTLGVSAAGQDVQAEAAGVPSSLGFNATATPGPVSASRSSLTASAPAITASTGDSTATITVTARDAHGNLIRGARVAFAASGSANMMAQSVDTTSPNGQNALVLSSTRAETKTISVTIDSTAIGEQATLTVAPAAAAALELAVHPSSTTAGSIITPVVQVTVRDMFANLVTAAATQITLQFGNNAGNGTLAGTVTQVPVAGVATFPDVSIDKAASGYTLVATSPALSSATSAPFVVTAASAARIARAGVDSQTATVHTAIPTPPAVIVRDQFDNPVSNIPVMFAIVSGGGTITDSAQTTIADGIATLGSWTLGTTAGPNTLTATAAGLAGLVTFTATGTPGVGTQLTVHAGETQSATVGAAIATRPAVLVRDQFDNPVSGIAVTFAVASGSGTITDSAQATNADGIATVGSWTLGTTAGANAVTATAAGLPASLVTFSATGTAADAASIAISAGNDQTATVNTVVAAPPAVIVRDQFSNPVSGVAVTFAVASGEGTVNPATAVTTDPSGIASVDTWTLGTTAGPNTLTATATGLPGSPVTFAAFSTAADAASIAISDGNDQTATVNTVVAAPPAVIVRDQFGNSVSGVAVTFEVASGSGTITASAQTTNADGIATVGSWTLGTTAGANTVTATAAGLPAGLVTFSATGTAAAAASIAISAGNDQTATVNMVVTAPPAVIVQDQFDNPVFGIPVTFAVASGSGTITDSAQATNADGIATIGSWTLGTTAGANTVTASAAGLPGSLVTFTATGTAADAASIAISDGNDQTATVNTVVAAPPAVIVRDQFGNPVSGVAVTFEVASGSGTITASAQATNADGIATIGSWTLGTIAGPYTLAAVASGLTASPVVFAAIATAGAPVADRSVVEASPTTLTASNGSSAATVTVTIRDAFGNLVSGATVTLAATGAGNSLTQPPGPTDASGQATGTFSSTRAETKTLTATVNDTVPIADTVTATVTHAAAAVIAADSDSEQSGHVEDAVATPPAVVVTDEYGNPVAGASVTFAVASGGGSVSPTSDVTTDTGGVAAATSWTLGPALGPNTVIARSAGVVGNVTFTAIGTLPPVPDPTALAPATGQAPDVAAYTAIDVPSQAAGFSYSDPGTGTRIWKVTDSAAPETNTGAGHDYADGGNQVSRGWGPGNNTHTILILTWRGPGDFAYYLVDFTRGVGFSDYRLLTVQPRGDLAATFSSVRSQARILYILTETQLVRYNTETMQTENTGNFPLTIAGDAWLHQDKSDVWFVGLTQDDAAFAWNSQTNELRTQSEDWLDEPRLDRDGRYVVLSSTETVRLWDLTTNTLGPTQVMDPGSVGPTAAFWFGHIASLRSRWVTANPNATVPAATDRYYVNGGQVAKVEVLGNSFGHLLHQAGNWIQYDAELGGDLDRQWAYGTGYGEDDPRFAWRHAVGLVRADGSDSRLLLHHYSSNDPEYYASPWGMPSPDGKVVIFNSDMLGSGRWDLFIAEMPIRLP